MCIQAQQQPSSKQPQPPPMSKDTIMSLYGRNAGMMQPANSYPIAGILMLSLKFSKLRFFKQSFNLRRGDVKNWFEKVIKRI